MMTEFIFFFFQAEDGIRDLTVTGVQTCALPIFPPPTPDIAIKTPPHGVVQQGDRRDQTLKLGFPHGAQYNAHPPGRPTPERRRAVADTPRVAFLPPDGAERPVLVKADTGCCKTYVHRL